MNPRFIVGTSIRLVCAGLALMCMSRLTAAMDSADRAQNANIDPEFADALFSQPMLIEQGGAVLIQVGTNRFFIAVGVTGVRGDSAQETLRQMRVGQIQAQKEAVAFVEQSNIVAEEKLVEKTTITTRDGEKSVEVYKSLDQTTAVTVKGMLRSLPQIGHWKSRDGKLFFYATGKKLP